jgi:hypothetical protein
MAGTNLTPDYWLERDVTRRPFIMGSDRPEAGRNLDRIDVASGLRELGACGYSEPHTAMVIEYALKRWARGEEDAAERGAIDRSFHGIDLTSWMRVLAAARAGGEASVRKTKGR